MAQDYYKIYKSYEPHLYMDYTGVFTKAFMYFNAWYNDYGINVSPKTDASKINNIFTTFSNHNNTFAVAINQLFDGGNLSDFAISFHNLVVALNDAELMNSEDSQEIKFFANDAIGYYTKDKYICLACIANHRKIDYDRYVSDRALHIENDRNGIPDSFVLNSEFEQYYYCKDTLLSNVDNKLSESIVRIMYCLRCNLLHGAIATTSTIEEVYRYAFEILNHILKTMFEKAIELYNNHIESIVNIFFINELSKFAYIRLVNFESWPKEIFDDFFNTLPNDLYTNRIKNDYDSFKKDVMIQLKSKYDETVALYNDFRNDLINHIIVRKKYISTPFDEALCNEWRDEFIVQNGVGFKYAEEIRSLDFYSQIMSISGD